ncbi:thiamine diphosphokinase [Gorillibacterium massiliense]|uniref:thiamine diphosphokinase n=1 Tax=Gorillibacterium massiliense TaxID=1280390 RepID=UPI0004B7940B|nr:thiamine diphosphokinase [Gorillibacterium massiliense]
MMTPYTKEHKASQIETNTAKRWDGRRAILFSGGNLGDWALAEVNPGDYLIGADRGALFLLQNGLKPDLSVGDFDSVTPEELALVRAGSASYEECDPVHKDLTDTEMAMERAFELNPPPAEILLFGALGTRFDHSLANVHLLLNALNRGIHARIIDKHNELIVLAAGQTATIRRGRFTHVSLLPLTLQVAGITLAGFQYPLFDAELTMGQSLGISNVLEDEIGTVTTKSGLILIIQSAD